MTVERMVFCDFDGTITVDETLRDTFLFYLPDLTPMVLEDLDRGFVTLREALLQLVAELPSDLAPEIIERMQSAPLRAGFENFCHYLHEQGIPLVVISSGFEFYLETKLAPWRPFIHAIHGLKVDLSGEKMALQLEYEHPTEALPKAAVMEHYAAKKRIAIGDARSDFEMAETADRVFARDKLLKHMRDRGLAVTPFDTFDDIIADLKQENSAHA